MKAGEEPGEVAAAAHSGHAQDVAPRTGIREWLLLLGAIAVSLTLAEVVVRKFLADGIVGWSNQLGWSMVPPVELRVRDAGDKRPGRTRILVLGDSQTEWRDVTGHSYVRVAERMVEAAGKKVQMINLAEAGTDVETYFGNFATYAPRLEPDLVVVGLYLGNDLFPALMPLDTPEGKMAAIRAVEPSTPDRPLWVRLAKQSVALNLGVLLVRNAYRRVRPDPLELLVAKLVDPDSGGVEPVIKRLQEVDASLVHAARTGAISMALLQNPIYFPDYYAELAAVETGTRAERELQGALRDIAALVGLCRTGGRKVLVVLIPPPVWISTSHHDFFRRLGHGRLGSVSGEVPVVKKLEVALSEMGVAVVNALPALRSEIAATYLENDDHLNRRGHEIVGRELARALLSAGLPGSMEKP